jgi:hypothetical protein
MTDSPGARRLAVELPTADDFQLERVFADIRRCAERLRGYCFPPHLSTGDMC